MRKRLREIIVKGNTPSVRVPVNLMSEIARLDRDEAELKKLVDERFRQYSQFLEQARAKFNQIVGQREAFRLVLSSDNGKEKPDVTAKS